MSMTHPGLQTIWGIVIVVAMMLIALWALLAPPGRGQGGFAFKLVRLPLVGPLMQRLTTGPGFLFVLKAVVVAIFLLIIAAGLLGTPIPERNLATVLTWNIWWAGLILSIFFLGSAWCAVCPWDALAHWLVRRRLWRRARPTGSLDLRVPRALRSVWPALFMLVALTWLELGAGITTNPYLTAVLALLMVVLATVSLSLFNHQAFCHYFCPVGRTIGVYSQLAPVALRPIDTETCARCQTLDCYHGNDQVEPCPTQLVMGRLKENTYCISCGNCTRSCPDQNIFWTLRTPSTEAMLDARPHLDEAWFMLGLLALTGFHGLTMMPYWEHWVSTLARVLNDSGQLLISFSVAMAAGLAPVIALYALAVGVVRLLLPALPFHRIFSGLAFVNLPLAFAYHLAHNLNHLSREGQGLGAVLANPLGSGVQPLSMLERHQRHLHMLVPEQALWLLQSGLMIFGFWVAVQIIRHRGAYLLRGATVPTWRFAPLVIFCLLISGFHLYLLMQPMVMRM